MALMAWARVTPFRGKHVSDYLIHIPNGGKRNVREAARLKRMGVRAGVPDYFLHVAAKRPTFSQAEPIWACGLWIELKANSASPIASSQLAQLTHLASCGYESVRADGWIEAAKHICAYLSIPCNVPCSS